MSENSSGGMGKTLALGVIIGIALVVAAFVLAGGFGKIANGFGTLASGFGTIAKQDRIVTVRGLAEREVDADMAIWPLTFNLATNDELPELQKELVQKITVVSDYLKNFGLTEADYTIQPPDITDTSLAMYSSEKSQYRYIAKQRVLVRSKNVKAVKTAQEHSLDLTKNSIAVLQDYDSKIVYEYTALNSIKPEMIGEATKNARAAASPPRSTSTSRSSPIRSRSA